jgi:SNF2 family DNA or RNA helicase
MTARRPFTPGAHQLEMIEHMYAHPRCALFARMGSGKTSAGLTFAHEVELVEPGRSLALAPLRVARDTWPDEAAKWEHLKGMSVVPIVGTEAERIAALKLDVSMHTINYDVLPWLIEYLLDNKLTWRWSRVFADESTRLKNFRLRNGGQRAQAIGKVAHTRVKRWINLTGTPSSNGLVDLWGQTWFLDAGARLGRTIEAFRSRWFSYDQYARTYSPQQSAQEQIHGALGDICITPTLPFSVDEPVIRPVYVELPPKARRQYNEMEKRMFAEISGHEIEAFTAAAKTMKCLQLANGAAYLERDEAEPMAKRRWVDVHDVKLQALESIVEEAGGTPVLVAYQFKSDRARILKAFPRAVDISKPEGMKTFRAGRAPIGAAHPASMGHGIDGLQDVTNLCAIFGHWWNLEEYLQLIERIGPVRQKQSGHDRAVFVYPIVAKDTVDELVMARRETKREVQDILLEAMKRKGVR